MHRLVCNSGGDHLYKRSNHLVRTPITVTLQPDERAYYSVAGTYDNQGGSVWWPDGGFIRQNTYNNVIAVGADCIQAYLNPGDWRQSWREVTDSHDPETAWYQGAYAPSAPSPSGSYNSCEAYIQLGAYHFTIPSAFDDAELTSVRVEFTNGGAANAYQSAGTQSANNSSLYGFGEFRNWYLPFVVVQSLGTPAQIGSAAYDDPVDILADTGTFRGVRDLWGFAGTTRDGGIVTLNTPVRKSFYMGSDTLGEMNAHRGGWIVPFLDVEYSGPGLGAYRPYYINPDNGYWGCFSVWGVSLEITVD